MSGAFSRALLRTSVVALAALTPAAAQEAMTYDLAEAEGGFEDVRGLGTRLPVSSDRGGVAVPLPFAFPFFDTVQAQVGVTTEGYLTFGGLPTNTPGELPSPVAPNGVVAPFWANLDITRHPGARIDMHTLGSAPARRFVVQWSDFPLAADAWARLTFQVALFEGTGAIELRYGRLVNGDGSTGAAAGGATATVGIEDTAGVEGVLFSRNTATLSAGKRLVLSRTPVRAPELVVRSAVGVPGSSVEVPIHINGPVRGLRGYQATFEVVAEAADAPPVALRAMSQGEAAAGYALAPDLATIEPVRLVLPVEEPLDDGSVPHHDGGKVVGAVRLVVPPDAPPGATYRLELRDVVAADPASRSLAVIVRSGRLTITSDGPPAALDRIDIVAAPRARAAEPTPIEVVVAGAGRPVAGAPVKLALDPGAATLESTEGVTDAEGRFRTTLVGAAPALIQVFASTPGLDLASTSITILDPTPPRILSTPGPLATVGSLYAYDATASSPGHAFDLERAPAGMTITPTGNVRWVPTAEQVGTHQVTVRIVDTSVRQTFSVLVQPVQAVPRPNQRPTITTTPPPTALLVGETFTYDVEASDPDGDVLAFTLGVSPATLTVDPSTGVVTWTPGPDDVGERRALVMVSDGFGGLDGQGLIFTVTAPPEDLPPVITSTPPLEAPLQQEYVYQVVAEDPEEQPVTYRLAYAPDGMEINPVTGEIRWFPSRLDDVYIPAQPIDLSGDTITTLGGDVAQLAHGRFEDPPNLVYGTLIDYGSAGGYGWNPSPLSFAYSGGRGPSGPGGLLYGYGDQRDYLWVQHAGPHPPGATVPGGDPAHGLLYDLHGPANKVVVFPVIDHGPLPGEALEHTVYLSDDRVTWTRARLELVFEDGWDPDPTHIAEGMVGVYSLPSGRTFRYASVVWGGPAAIRADLDTEIDAVAGLTEGGGGLGGPSETTVVVEVVDAAGNVTRQEFTLAVPGHAEVDVCPDVVDFGDVALGSTERRQVLVDNTGTMPLRVTGVQVLGGGAGFKAEEVLVTGETVIEIEFAPATVGAVSSTVYVTTTAGGAPITVTGRGVDPAATPPRPRITSDPPVVAVVGRELVYTVRAEDPLRGGLSYALEEGPEGARVQPVSGVLRWTPTPDQVGTATLAVRVTDAAGESALQRWCVVALSLNLEVEVTPRRVPVGTNDFDVVVRVDIQPPRLVQGSGGSADRLILEHVLPPGVELIPSSVTVPMAGSTATPDGTTLSWRVPLDVFRFGFAVRATDMAPGPRAVSVETRARFAFQEEVGGLSALLRTISTPPLGSDEPRGLGVDLANRRLLLSDPRADRLISVNARTGASEGAVGVSPSPHDAEQAAAPGTVLLIDDQQQRLVEVLRSNGTVTRSTRTDGIAPNLRGLAVDPRSGRRFMASPTTGKLYVHDRRFGAHLKAPSLLPTDVATDPLTGDLIVVDDWPNEVYRLDPVTGAVKSAFSLDRNVQGVAVSPDGSEIHALDQTTGRIYTFSSTGTLRRSTRVDHHGLGAAGLDIHPTTGELLLSDTQGDKVVRLGPGFTRHLPAPAERSVGIDVDPSTGDLIVADTWRNNVYRLDPVTGAVESAFSRSGSSVAVSPDGSEIHVLNPSTDRIYTHSSTGTFRRSTRVDHHAFDAVGLDVHPTTGEFLLSDTQGDKVVRLGPDFTRHRPAPAERSVGIDVDPSTGDLIVADNWRNNVYRLDPVTGAIKSAFSRSGSGVALSSDGSEIHVLDPSNDRIYTHSSTGTFRRSTRVDHHGLDAVGLDVHPTTGEFLLSDTQGDKVVRLGPGFTRHLPAPAERSVGIDVDPSTGDLIVADNWRNNVYRLDPVTGAVESAFSRSGSSVAVSPDGSEIHVLDPSTDRIYTHSSTGTFRRSTRVDHHAFDAVGLDVHPTTGEFLLSDTQGDKVVRLGPDFTRHRPAPAERSVGIDVDPSTGDLIVADNWRNIVYRLDPVTGVVKSSFSRSGSGVAVSPDGSEIHVLDPASDRIYTHSSTGTFRRSTRLDQHASNALGLDVDADGAFLVADQATRRVIRLGGGFTDHLPLLGLPSAPSDVRGVTFDPATGNLLLVDTTTDRVYRLTSSGAHISNFSIGSRTGNAEGLTVDPGTGDILVVSSSPRAVFRFDPSGGFQGSTTIGFGSALTGIAAVLDGVTTRWFVTDSGATPQVHLVDPAAPGAPLASFGTAAFACLTPGDVALAADGANLAIVDRTSGTLHEVTTAGALVRSISTRDYGAFGPAGVAFDGERYLVADPLEDSVFRIGTPGMSVGILTTPTGTDLSGVSVGPGGTTCVTDSAGDRLLLFSSAGTLEKEVSTAAYGCFSPSSLAFDGTRFWVTDDVEDRLFEVDPEGLLQSSISTAPHALDPQGLSFGPGDTICVTDLVTKQLLTLDPAGALVKTISTAAYGSFSPSGLAFDGTRFWVTDDDEDRLFEIAPEGLPQSSVSTAPHALDPQGLSFGPGDTICVTDRATRQLLTFDPAGALVKTISTASYGSFSPSGLAFDGTRFWVTDDDEDRLFEVDPEGLPQSSISTAPHALDPQGLSFGPGNTICVTDLATRQLLTFGPTGTLVKTISTAAYGSFSPTGLAFDGTRFWVTDDDEDRVFEVDPEGLPVTTFSTAALGSLEPSDVALHPNGNVAIVDRTSRELIEATPEGQLVTRHDLRQLGVFTPSGLGRGPEGDLWISDDAEDRLFPMAPTGPGLTEIDLAAQEIANIDGLAFDPLAGTLFLSNDTTIWEACVSPFDLDTMWTLELSLFEGIGAADDIAVDRAAGELYVVSAATDRIYVFALPDRHFTRTPAKVLLITDGHPKDTAHALEARGHVVVSRPLAGGVLAADLDPTFSQVWIEASRASSGAVFTSADLAALEAWRRTTERTGLVIDGLALRDRCSCAQEVYTHRLVGVVEEAGGGLVLSAGPEVVPAGGVADGSGGAVAALNQLLDRLGVRPITGAYETLACEPAGGSTFPEPQLELLGLDEQQCACQQALMAACDPANFRRDVLVGSGELFDRPPSLDADELLGRGLLLHPELPVGPQLGTPELFASLEGEYTRALTGSPELPGKRAHLLVATSRAIAGYPEVTVGAQWVEVDPIVSIVPVAQTTVPLGTSVFAVTVQNVLDRDATFVLSPGALPAGFVATLPESEVVVPANDARGLLLTVSAGADVAEQTLDVSVQATERVAPDDLRDRGSASAALHVVNDVLTIPVAIDPVRRAGRSGDALTWTVRVTNPRPTTRTLRVQLGGLDALGAPAPAPVEVSVEGAATVSVPLTFVADAEPGDYVFVARADAIGDVGLLPGFASASATLSPPNLVPVAIAGGDLTYTAPAPGSTVSARLDGRASYDPDGDPLTYRWEGPTGVHEGATPALPLAPGVYEFTLVVSDGADTSPPDLVIVTIGDMTPPEIGPMPDRVVEQLSRDGTPVDFDLVVSDDVGAGFQVSATPAPGESFPLGDTLVTCTAVDASGNSAAASFTVRVVDTTPPVLAPAPDVVVETLDPAGALVSFEPPTATDVCDASPVVACSPASGTFFAFGDTVVTCTATDASGNLATSTFVVTVREPLDAVPPTLAIDAPAEGALLATRAVAVDLSYADDEAGQGVDPSTLRVLADGVDVSDLFASTATVATASAVVPFAADGAHDVRATIADRRGNVSAEVVRRFVVDTTSPVIDAADVVVEQADLAGTPATVAATVTDALDPSPALTSDAPAVFPLGVTPVTLTATDAAGNTSSRTVTVTVVDTTPPALVGPSDLTVEQEALAGTVVVFPAPTVSDACDATPQVVFEPPSGTAFPLGRTDVTLTVTDASGNWSRATFAVNVVDTTAPFVNVGPEDLAVEATGPDGAVVTYPPVSVVDACDATPVVACTPPSGSRFPVGTTVVQCEASDVSGNARAFTFTVTVRDTTPPTITTPPDVTVEQADAAGTAVSFDTPTASDSVDPSPAVTTSHAPGDRFPLGTTTVTCTARDAAGNETTATFTVTVVDTTPPELGATADLVVDATGPDGAVVSYAAPAASDVCDAAPTVECTPPPGEILPVGVTTVTCTATDASGNSTTRTFTVTVRDTTPPALEQPVDVVVEQATADGTAVSYPVPTATDLVDPDPTVTCVPPPGTVFPLGATTVTCTATDAAGNEATVAFTVTVVDTTPPTLSTPPDLTLEATGPDGAVVTFDPPGASDVCDASPRVECVPASGSTFAPGLTTVTCTATDASGNQATVTFTVTVRDTTPPTITTPPDVTVEQADAAGTAVSFALPTATDSVDPSPAVTTSHAPGDRFPLGTTTVTCTARDAAGNETTATFTVTVVDTTPPELGATADLVLDATGPDGAVVSYAAPAASDVCDAAPTVECTPPPGEVLPAGVTTVTCTATDASGNSTTRTFTVTVRDTTPPTLEQPLDLVVEQATADGTTVSYPVPTATDLVDPDPTVTCVPPPGTVFPLGATTVTCTATDAAGNEATVAFTVTVVDTTPPTLSTPPDLTLEATGPDGAVVTFDPPGASDVCDASPRVECVPASGSTFAPGLTTVTCTATDASGNQATVTFTVTVRDTTPPTITTPPDVTVEQADAAGTAVSFALPTATDSVDPSPAVTTSHAPGDRFPLGTTTVTCTARDAAGNETTATFTVTVVDTTPPELGATADLVLDATGPDGAVVSYAAPAASDVCDAAPTVECTPPPGEVLPVGVTTVTCTATDASGNSTTRTFTVTVRDTTPPTLEQPLDLVVEQATADGTTVSYPVPTATDLVDPDPTVTCTPPPGTVFPLGATTVTCTATDAAGNEATVAFTVTVVDTTPPTLSTPPDLTLEATGPDGAVVTFDPPVASDVCDASPRVECVPASGSTFAPGLTTVTCTATDASGNQATVTFTVTVRDTTPPTITTPPDVTVEQADAAGTAVSFDTSTASDSVDPSPAVTTSHAPGDRFPLGTTTVTCTARDAAGNETTATFTVTVVDTTPPELGATPDLVLDATGPDGTVVSYAAPAASDVCDAAPTVECTPPPGEVLPVGVTTVTCTATDASGNSTTRTFTVTVRDTTPPTPEQPLDLVVEQATADGTAVSYPVPTATDLVDPDPTVTCVPPPGTVFPLGATTVTCTATDAAGNEATVAFTVTVVDTTPPTLSTPPDLTFEAGPAGLVVTFDPPVGSDVCDASPRVECVPASGSTFAPGVTTVTCTATDASGNQAVVTFTVTVIEVGDVTPPTLAAPPDVTVEQETTSGTAVSYPVPEATDDVDPSPVVVCTPPPGTVFPLGATTVTCTATDAAGNAASVQFTVRVVDTTPPALERPADVVVEQTTHEGTRVTFDAPAVEDACDAAPTVVFSPPSGTVFPLGDTDVTCTAVDASGNESTRTFTVTVRDTTQPELVVPPDLTITAPPGPPVPVTDPEVVAWLAAARATDACDAAPFVSDDAPDALPVGEATAVTFTATDASGNTTVRTARILVVELEVTITSPTDGLCTAEDVTVTYTVTGHPDAVTLSGTRTRAGVVSPAGPGPVYTEEGDHRVEVTASTSRGDVTAAVTFSIDRTSPVVTLTSPVADPHPERPYPTSEYLVLPCGVDGDADACAACADARAGCARDHDRGDDCDDDHRDGHECRRDHDRGDDCHDDHRGHHGHRGDDCRRDHDRDDDCHDDHGGRGDCGRDHDRDDDCHDDHRGKSKGNGKHDHDACGRDHDRDDDCHDDHGGGRGDCGRDHDRDDDCHEHDDDSGAPTECCLPIPLAYTAHDDDGIAGGVASVEVRLDGVTIPPSTTRLDQALFDSLSLPVLGRHVLEVTATDRAGNVGQASVTFEVVLFGPVGSGLLTIKAESLKANGGVLTAFFELPDCGPLGPSLDDVVLETLVLEAVATGRRAAPEGVNVAGHKLVIKFRRSDLSSNGTLGTSFVLTGRLFSTAGPAFAASDEVKKNP